LPGDGHDIELTCEGPYLLKAARPGTSRALPQAGVWAAAPEPAAARPPVDASRYRDSCRRDHDDHQGETSRP